ncbi:MAG: HAD-IA family hydrolase [Kangiellaceae bacterium]|nr:HAD-IA family hydrolase [Kangiellaceae bacterium]
MLDDFELVIFDWDGTLMDSTGRIVSAMQTTARNLKLPIPTASQVKAIIGLSLDECYQRLFPEVTDHDWITQEYRYQYVEGDQTPSPLFTGVSDTLHSLKSRGYKLAVATGKARHGLDRVLLESGLTGLFDLTIASDESKSKPDPHMLVSLLKRSQCKTHQAIMIGDTSYDLEMAQNANMASIGVSFGAHSVDVLKQYNPKAIIDCFTELM